MLEDSQFHCLADAYLDAMCDRIEDCDRQGLIEADLENGVLTITMASGHQYLVSKHQPTKQLWLSSPVSGGLHFRYNEEVSAWELEDGRKLSHILAEELQQETGISFQFAT